MRKDFFPSYIFLFVDFSLVMIFFMSGRTAVFGYFLNGLIVINGTVFMTHFSIAEISAKSISAHAWFLKSTLADIDIAGVGFSMGRALFGLTMRESPEISILIEKGVSSGFRFIS